MSASELADSSVDLGELDRLQRRMPLGLQHRLGDAVPDVTQTPDWVEAFAQKQATLIAGTGYQYGDTDFLAYSDKLYADFSHDLRLYPAGSTPGAVAVGAALVQAKQDYLDGSSETYPNQAGTGIAADVSTIPTNANTTNLQGIDIKSLLEATLYGLPMLSVDLPDGRIPVQTSASIVPTPTNGAASGTPGGALGLSTADITLDTANNYGSATEPATGLTPEAAMLASTGGVNLSATYLEGPDGITTSPGAPALPLARSNVSVADQVLRGVGFWSGSYTDTPTVTPLTGAPATELNGVHYTFASSTFYPERLGTVDYFGGLSDGSDSAELMLTPVQYISDAPGSLTDTQREYSSVGLRLFYSDNTSTYGSNVPSLAAPPTISRVDATVNADGSVTVDAHVVGDPVAGIQEVWVTYTSPLDGSGQWQSVDLVQSQSDPTLWSATLTGLTPAQTAALEFVVQAADGVGLVSLDDNQGSSFQPGLIAPALLTSGLGPAPSTLTLTPPPAATFGSSVNVSATLKAGETALASEPVNFSIDGGLAVSALTDSNGVASASLTVNTAPGSSHQLTATFAGTPANAGSPGLAASSDSTTSFTINPAATSLTLGGGPTVSWGLNSPITATLSSGGSGAGTPSTVAFVFTPTNGTPGPTLIQTETTGGAGVAADAIGTQLSAGTYAVLECWLRRPDNAPDRPRLQRKQVGPARAGGDRSQPSGDHCNRLAGSKHERLEQHPGHGHLRLL